MLPAIAVHRMGFMVNPVEIMGFMVGPIRLVTAGCWVTRLMVQFMEFLHMQMLGHFMETLRPIPQVMHALIRA